jgi:transposase-like protein
MRVSAFIMTKKTYTSAFKAQVVLEILKEEKTSAQLASEYGVHPNLLREWKLIALKALPTAFEKCDTLAAAQDAHEEQLQQLYAEIGRLTTHVTFLKKKLPL